MNPPEKFDLDLGSGYYLQFTRWAPDREYNPHYADLPDTDRLGALIYHPSGGQDHRPAGEPCCGAIYFDCEQARRVFPGKPLWSVQSWDPLTISPSVLCSCGSHGFIRGGKWVTA